MTAICRFVLSCVLLTVAASSSAQLGLPPLPTQGLPVPPLPTERLPSPAQMPNPVDARQLLSSVRARARALLQRYPDQVERDPRGAPVVRSVIVALSPDGEALQRAVARGFEIQSDETLQPLGERIVTLLAPPRLTTRRALRDLRTADPSGTYDFDHLFVSMQSAVVSNPHGAAGAATLPEPVDIRVGLIDGGVDVGHPVFASQRPQLSGCDGNPTASEHGTAVASLFVGLSPEFRGAAPGARLEAVDVYCDGATPGGRVRDIVAALGALMAADVRVINMSIVGPDNAVLAAVVRKVIAQSIIVVAASGNDGPNAAPLYPAAYPGVVAVTAVDANEKLLIEAGGGDHVRFAAPGADMLAASSDGQFKTVRGTSYASPLVAGLLARLLARGDGIAVEQVVQELAATAEDRSKAPRAVRHGYGLVGMELRTDPSTFAGRAAPQ
jgi:subtilisin family serine protease